MSKELNVLDCPVNELADTVEIPTLIKLDDLSLALVGGGQGAVCL